MSKENPVTHICTADEHHIWIRGKQLVRDLIGHMTFTEMMLFHFLKKPPTPMQTTILDAVLITIMEHGLTPSAIAARQTFLGAPESLQGAVAAGLLGVGSRFAGTAGDCAKLLDEIVAAPRADWEAVARKIAQRHRETRTPLPGYGHPIHKSSDARTTRLCDIALEAGAEGKYIDAMNLLGEAMNAEINKTLVINASAAIGAVLREAGIPAHIMRGVVMVSRCAGLVGHLLEEMEEPSAARVWHMVEEGIPYEGEKS